MRVNRSGDISPWEVPEIDGVRMSLEHRIWDDETSDQWWELIDRATDPRPLTVDRADRIAQLLGQFRDNDAYMRRVLVRGAVFFDTPELVGHYDSALEQVTELTGVDRPVLADV